MVEMRSIDGSSDDGTNRRMAHRHGISSRVVHINSLDDTLDNVILPFLLGVARNALRTIHETPNTSFLVLAMIYLHFEWDLRGKSILNRDNPAHSFVPTKIVFEKQYYRILSSQLLHCNNFHLLLNMTFLLVMRHEEQRFVIPGPWYSVFLAGIMVLKAIIHVGLVSVFQHSKMNQSSLGFSGVLFALSAMVKIHHSRLAGLNYPIWSLVRTLPAAKPGSSSPLMRLLGHLVAGSVLMRNASVWGHLAGILAGYLTFSLQRAGFCTLYNYQVYYTKSFTLPNDGLTHHLTSTVAIAIAAAIFLIFGLGLVIGGRSEARRCHTQTSGYAVRRKIRRDTPFLHRPPRSAGSERANKTEVVFSKDKIPSMKQISGYLRYESSFVAADKSSQVPSSGRMMGTVTVPKVGSIFRLIFSPWKLVAVVDVFRSGNSKNSDEEQPLMQYV